MLRDTLFNVLLSLTSMAATAQSTDSVVVGIQDIAWSPDGRYILCSAIARKPDWSDFAPHKWGIHRLDVESRADTLVSDSAFTVAVSPTGDRMAVGKLVNGIRSIHIMDPDGHHARPVTMGATTDYWPSWSPDGKALVYNSIIDKKVEICRINADGSGYTRITTSTGDHAHSPVWSPDGDRIVYYLVKGDNMDQVHVMNADGTEDRNLTNDTLSNTYPAWLDARTITFTRASASKIGTAQPYVMDIDGMAPAPLTDRRSFYTRPSPDGTRLAFIDDGNIRIVARDTGKEIVVLRPGF